MPGTLQGRPVIFGEVLYDVFPDGQRILGGAPFNLAWHLKGLGEDPLFISRVGDDPAGEQIRAAMADWGLDTRGLQTDLEQPTGTVQVSFGEDGQPAYEIHSPCAYDVIDAGEALTLVHTQETALICHGSLIARHPLSRSTLEMLRREAGLPCFVDINLRAPWWNLDRVERLLHRVRWLKLNDEELARLSGRELEGKMELFEAARELQARHELDSVLITRGAQGALLLERGETCSGAPAAVDNLVDTVGAGDAFGAMFLFGLLRGWPAEQRLKRALEFAAAICGIRGAISHDPALYQRFAEASAG
jgi:fructokinase